MSSSNGGQASRRPVDTQEEAMYRRIVEEFPEVCVSLAGSDGLVTSSWVGEHYAQISGYEVGELVADPMLWLSIIHPADRERVSQARRLLVAGKPMQEHYRIFRKDGQMRSIVEGGTTGQLGDAGTPLLRCAMDISGTQAESAISYRELVDEAPVGISVRDLGGRVIYCNKAYAWIFGYDASEQMIGTDFLDIMAPVTLEDFNENIFPRILEGAWSGEVAVHRKDGEERILQLSTNVFRGPDGDPLAAYALILDISELKYTTSALQESRELLRAVKDAMAANLAVVDGDGVIIAVNERWRRFARENGDPELASTCEGVNYLDVCRRAQGPRSEGADEAFAGLTAILRRESHEFEAEYPCPSGTEDRWFLMRANSLGDERPGALIAHIDISRRKRAEEALRSSEELLRRRYDAISAGLLVMDLRGSVVHVNRAACSILKMSPELILGTTTEAPVWRAIREDGSQFPIDELPAIITLRTGQPTRGTQIGFFCGRPETCKWLLINSEPILDPDTGELREVIAAFLDITDSKRVEAALRESEARYHSLTENLDAVVFRMDRSMRLLALTGRIEAMLGYSPDQFAETPSLWEDVVHPDDSQKVVELMRSARDTRSPQSIELRIRHQSGKVVWVRGTLTPIFDSEGKFVYYDGVSLDITERVEAQERDARHAARMRVLTEMSQELVSNLDAGQILDAATRHICNALGCAAAGVNIEPSSGRLLRSFPHCPKGRDIERLDRTLRDVDLTVEKAFGMMEVMPRIVPDMRKSSPALAKLAARWGLGPGIIAPVTAGEEVVGVLMTARPSGQQFDQEDIRFVSEVASHATAALATAALYRRQAVIAETLQRSLIPSEPTVGFLDMATLYAPAPGEARVGGDFFDIMIFNGERVGLVVGDVSGKGLEAAIHTAETKYMLRAFAHQNPDPQYVITSLNAILCDYLPNETFVTLVYFLIDARQHTMTYVNAGHETSIIRYHRDGGIREIGPNGPMLGVTASVGYSEGHAVLGPHDLLFCYTDGVIDVRINGERFGYPRLRETVTSVPAPDAKTLLDGVMGRVRNLGAARQTDDQVIVVVRPLV